MIDEILPLLPAGWSPEALWRRAFAETYRTELRAERSDQPGRLYSESTTYRFFEP